MLLVLALYAMYVFVPPCSHTDPRVNYMYTKEWNTIPYVVVYGVELISDTFTVPTTLRVLL